MSQCPSCGAAVASGDRDCPSCGTRLTGTTESFPVVGSHEPTADETTETVEGAVLVVRKGPEVGERFYVDRPTLIIGRDPGSDIFLNDVTVSREHARLEVSGGRLTLRDAGSLNGTYVNGIRVDAAPLRSGDAVQIGRFQMVFLEGGGA